MAAQQTVSADLASILRTIDLYRSLGGTNREHRALREMAQYVEVFDLNPEVIDEITGQLKWKHGVSWLPVQERLSYNCTPGGHQGDCYNTTDHCTDCFRPITPAALYVSLFGGPRCRACTERRHPGGTVDVS